MATKKKRVRAQKAAPIIGEQKESVNLLQATRNSGLVFSGQVRQMDEAMDEGLVAATSEHLRNLLASNRARGKTQWWNPTLCAQIDIQRLASQAIVEKRWEDVVALGAMMLVKSA